MSTPSQRIAQIVADGRPGGGTTMVLGLIDDLRAGGYEQLTVVSQPRSYMAEQVQKRGLPFIDFDFFTGFADIGLPRRLARRLGECRFELTHLHGLRAAHTAVRWPVRECLGRLVYTVHGLHQLHQAAWLRWLANAAERQVMRRVDVRVFVSRADRAAAEASRLMPRGWACQVVYNGIELPPLGVETGGSRDIDVAFVGRHVAQKAPLAAARVLATLAMRGYRCVMAGDGPLRPACEALLQQIPGGNRVERWGDLSQVEALGLLARTRLLVMPSRWEGLPLLPMEAMALGVPVVASRLAGIAEVVDDDATGVLTPPGNENAMVDASHALLSDPQRLKRLQEAARRRVGELFDRGQSSAQYRRLYGQLLSP